MLDFERIFTTLVNSLTEQLGDESSLGLHGSMSGGVAAIADIVTVQSGAPSGDVRVAVAAQEDVFEGELRKSERAIWAAEEIRSDKYGVREVGSSLVEGQFLVSAASGVFLTTRLLQKLDLEDGWYFGPAIDTLAGQNGLQPDLTGVYAMANKASIMASATEPEVFKWDSLTNKTEVLLDGVYSSIKRGSVVALELGTLSGAYWVDSSETVIAELPFTPPAQVPATRIRLLLTNDIDNFDAHAITVHFDARKVGEIEKIPTKTVTLTQILEGPHPVQPAGSPALPVTAVDIVIQDAEDTALIAKGDVYTTNDGTTRVRITDIPEQGFAGELVKPITFHWGLTRVTRGETIQREVLGSGDATQRWQTFELGKSPLTYVADPSAPGGRRPELSIFVNGRQWRHAPSFYNARPADEIFVIKHDASHKTQIIFGDGELGARLPTGANNVVARYRHGVGGNVDARAIRRLAIAATGVTSVINPVAAGGGEDPPTPAQARERAIQATRVLGKLVGLPDFEVEATRWGGVLAARASWDWDPRSDEALVNLWIIAPGPADPSTVLQEYLQALSEPGTTVRVQKAAAEAFAYSIQLEIEPGYLVEEVRAAVRERLLDDVSGFFAPRNASIGGVFRRSELYAAIHEVPGVAHVRAVGNDGEVPAGFAICKGKYLAPTSSLLGPNPPVL